ncbi:endonuclease-reverse transcriptase [Elysia marginata]|uniref:Endonuclease-reverse transcriptase n=1 Tax=Elysia marginata TaxID=1093978 RepID=A0AAV4H385_9GAST|nr:endonuclease-reverse transcriptase [Elysia marginata]
MTKGDENKIDVFQSRCLRQILRAKWSDRITNSKVLETARMETISGIIRKRRWKYIGHILRKEADSACITALTWAPEGNRRQERPKTTWRRMVEKERMTTGWRSWQHARTIALNRDEWRTSVEALCATWREVDRCECPSGYSGRHCEKNIGDQHQCGPCPTGWTCKFATDVVCVKAPCVAFTCMPPVFTDPCGGCPVGKTCKTFYPPCAPPPPGCADNSLLPTLRRRRSIPCPQHNCDPVHVCL